jgi:hypothetical protein
MLMLRNILCWTLLVASTGALEAQSGFTFEGKNSMVVFDNNGKAFENPPTDIAGSPFLRDDWRLGSVILAGQPRRFDSVKIRLNLMTQEVHFINRDNIEIALFRGYIGSIRFYDSSKIPGGAGEFRSGFPAIDNQDESNFYEVLCKGKIWLLESLRKIISQEKNEFSGEIKKEFVSYEDYYLFNGTSMSRLKKERSFLVGQFPGQQDKIASFIDANHLKLKTIDEIRRVVDYYNSLP